MPEGLAEGLTHLRAFWDSAPETWSFWQRWYDGMLTGEPMDWELQRRVALIPDDVWEKGPEAVAREIARIEAQHDVRARIDELEQERERLIANRHGIGGNRPPEPLSDPPAADQI